MRDCILLEHVEAFSVTTHVMVRVVKPSPSPATSDDIDTEQKSGESDVDNTESELVSLFPDAKLSFNRCHALVQKIRRALQELR